MVDELPLQLLLGQLGDLVDGQLRQKLFDSRPLLLDLDLDFIGDTTAFDQQRAAELFLDRVELRLRQLRQLTLEIQRHLVGDPLHAGLRLLEEIGLQLRGKLLRLLQHLRLELRPHLFKSLHGLLAIGGCRLDGGIHELLTQRGPHIVDLRHQGILHLGRVELPLQRAVKPKAEEAHQSQQQDRTSKHKQPDLSLCIGQIIESLFEAVDDLFQIVAAAAWGRVVA